MSSIASTVCAPTPQPIVDGCNHSYVITDIYDSDGNVIQTILVCSLCGDVA